MPIYEYECEKCGNKFEILSGYNGKKAERCPACKGSAHRIFSPVPIIFKGQGFYITDSRKEKETQKSESKKETTASSTPKEKTTVEQKVEEKK